VVVAVTDQLHQSDKFDRSGETSTQRIQREQILRFLLTYQMVVKDQSGYLLIKICVYKGLTRQAWATINRLGREMSLFRHSSVPEIGTAVPPKR
jgi:hypothetical protein